MPSGGSTGAKAPSRATARVLIAVEAASAPCTVDDVASRLGITAATARKHLDELVREGAVQAESERSGRPGRPRLRYRSCAPPPSARAYELLARLLLEMVSAGEPPETVGRRVGGRHPVQEGESPEDVLLRVMAEEGFQPELVDGPEGPVMSFHRCPYADAALDHPNVVCALHRALAEGVLARGADRALVGALEVRDPRRAGCRLHLTASR